LFEEQGAALGGPWPEKLSESAQVGL
jgi:hypothetical protein